MAFKYRKAKSSTDSFAIVCNLSNVSLSIVSHWADFDKKGLPQVLIVVPTRELCTQVTKDIEDELGMAIIDGIANGVLDDMPIWDHKSYVAQPILCDGDGPINKFRKWVSQFYSDPLQAR